MDGPTSLRTTDLGVRYGPVEALTGVSLDFDPGQATALMGPNGSGKTTLLDCLAGLRPPTSGKLDRNGLSVGYVRQALPRRWLPLTAREVVTMGRYGRTGLMGRLTDADSDAISAAASRSGVTALFGRQFGELSTGQRQRVMLAQALASHPTTLLLDEPLTGLDIPSQERILAVIAEEVGRDTMVVVSTHHLDEARHCDRVVLLDRRVVAVGPPDTVLEPKLLRETFGARILGDHADHDHDHALLVLDDHGHEH